jgi:predicted RecB family nuclease
LQLVVIDYQRKGAEYGGAWAMATLIEATETADEGRREELMDKIVAYNKEDLETTWAVFLWLKSKVPARENGVKRGSSRMKIRST